MKKITIFKNQGSWFQSSSTEEEKKILLENKNLNIQEKLNLAHLSEISDWVNNVKKLLEEKTKKTISDEELTLLLNSVKFNDGVEGLYYQDK